MTRIPAQSCDQAPGSSLWLGDSPTASLRVDTQRPMTLRPMTLRPMTLRMVVSQF